MYISTAWSNVIAFDAATGEVLWKLRSRGPGLAMGRGVLRRGQPRRRGVGRQDLRRHARRAADRARRHDRRAALGQCSPSTSRSPTPSPARRASSTARCSSATAAPSSACAATSPPMTPRPASWSGASTPCPATRRTASRRGLGRGHGDGRARPGPASGGSSAAAAPCGTLIAYDPESRPGLLSASATARRGTQHFRSPGGGDNLFLASIVALDPDTGKYVWHYQTTPGEEWDYTATQQMILADLHDRREAAQGADAGAEERLLLRPRPRDRRS